MPTAIVTRKNVFKGSGVNVERVPVGTEVQFEGKLPAYLVGKCRIEGADVEVATPSAAVTGDEEPFVLKDGTEMTLEELRANYQDIVGDPGRKQPKTLLKELEEALADEG